MYGVGGESGMQKDPQKKESEPEVMGAGKRLRRKINGGGGSGLWTDLQSKEPKW